MAYSDARKAFNENLALISNPMQEPLIYNLSQGLLQLTAQIEQDVSALKKKLADIEGTLNALG